MTLLLRHVSAGMLIRMVFAQWAHVTPYLGQHWLRYGVTIAWQHQTISWSSVDIFYHERISVNLYSEFKTFYSRKTHLDLWFAKWRPFCPGLSILTHWDRVTHICVSKLTTTGPDNGLSSGRRQAIIWTNAWILLIQTLGTNNDILIEIDTFSIKKMYLKMSSGKWRPFCSGFYVLRELGRARRDLIQFSAAWAGNLH